MFRGVFLCRFKRCDKCAEIIGGCLDCRVDRHKSDILQIVLDLFQLALIFAQIGIVCKVILECLVFPNGVQAVAQQPNLLRHLYGVVAGIIPGKPLALIFQNIFIQIQRVCGRGFIHAAIHHHANGLFRFLGIILGKRIDHIQTAAVHLGEPAHHIGRRQGGKRCLLCNQLMRQDVRQIEKFFHRCRGNILFGNRQRIIDLHMVKFLTGEGPDAVFKGHGVDHGAGCVDDLRICGSPLRAGKQAGIIFRRHNAVAARLFQSGNVDKRRRLIGHAIPNRAVLQPACGEHCLFLLTQLCAGGQACGNDRCHIVFCNGFALSSGNQRITRDGINIALVIQLSVNRIIIGFFGVRVLFQRHGIAVGHGQLRFCFIIQRQRIFLRHI